MPVTIARPRPVLPIPQQQSARALVVQGAAPPTLSQQFGTWNFAVRVYIAFDGPLTPWPTWIDITDYTETDRSTISIRRGRADGKADVDAGTCTITVDNSDGRFTASNPLGPWYGQIKKGAWLRVDIWPPSGIVSTRFVGFITSLPVKWKGQYATSEISASDRFVLLTQVRPLNGWMADRMLADPNCGQDLIGYWPLHEAQVGPYGTQYVQDISGLAPAGQQQLAVQTFGLPRGTGIQFSATPAPGFDGLSSVQFSGAGGNSPGPNGIGTTGATLLGSYLTANLAPMGNLWEIVIWVNTVTLNQPIWALNDPTTNYSLGIYLDATGLLGAWQAPLTGTNANVSNRSLGILLPSGDFSKYSLADGQWHQISVIVATKNSSVSGAPFIATMVDGGYGGVQQVFGTSNPATGFSPPASLTQFQLGGVWGWNGDESATAPAFFTGSVSDLAIYQLPSFSTLPMTDVGYLDTTGFFLGEDAGIATLGLALRSRNLPVPINPTASFLNGTGIVQADFTYGTTPFVNIPGPTAHPVGTQVTAGKNMLDAMRECARTENMPLFIDRQGRLTLQPSTLRQNPTAAFTINALDLEDGTDFADDFQYTINQTVVTPAGQTAVTVNLNGLASQAKYGIYSTSLDTYSLNVAEATSLGAATNFAGSDPPPRPTIVVEAATLATQVGYSAAWYDEVLAAEISTCFQVTGWPEQAPSSSASYYVEGYTETISAGQHTFSWSTSPVQGPTYQCDSPTLGLIDTPGITLAY